MIYDNKHFSLPEEIEREYYFTALLSLHENAIVFSMERKNVPTKKTYSGSPKPSSVVLKIMPAAYFDEILFDSLQSLHHPLLLLPTELFTEQDYVYAIYPELLPFSEYLCGREFPFSVILQWIKDMDESISSLHRKNICHGDIAPGNIYWGEENHFYLGDFSSGTFLSPRRKAMSFFKAGKKTASTFSFPRTATGFQQDIFSFLTILAQLLKSLTLPEEKEITALSPLINQVEKLLSQMTREGYFDISFHQVCQNILSVIENNQLASQFSSCTFTLSASEIDFFKESTKSIRKGVFPSFSLLKYKIPVSFLCLAFCAILFLSAAAFYGSRDNSPSNPDFSPTESTAAPDSPVLDISHKQYQELPAEITVDSSVKIIFAEDNRLETLSFFSKYLSLEELYLDENCITHIADISRLKSLSILGLSNNQIGDVSPLENLSSLRILDLSCQTGLGNLSSLGRLKKLQCLVLTGTNVTEEEIQNLQQALPSCNILY